MECSKGMKGMPKDMGWRVGATIILGVGWLSFIILFLAFWVTGLSFWQTLAVLVVSIIILCGILAGMWASWGIKMAEKMSEDAEKPKRKKE